jgi:hypothetical protein
MENNAGNYNILEDDQYADIYIDLERNKPTEKQHDNNMLYINEEDSDINSVQISMSGVYENDLVPENDKDKQFIHKLQHELEQVKLSDQSVYSINDGNHSPLSMSVDSRSVNSESDAETDYTAGKNNHSKFHKLTFEEVEASLNKTYTKEIRLASELDILLTYLKGQKHIFKLANQITLQKFYALMFPAIFITGSITLIGPFFQTLQWSGWVLSSLNALLTVLIAVNNFLKWQATAALFHNIAYQFDNLAISVEMTRNQLFVDDEKERSRLTFEKMKETEKRIMDIKYSHNNLILPYEVQIHNPIITHINIFSFIKKIEHHSKNLILKYKDIKNEIRYIMYKWEKESRGCVTTIEYKKQNEIKRLEHLMKEKEVIKQEILETNSNNVYAYIDTLFTVEMQSSEEYYSYNSAGMYLLRPIPAFPELNGNAVVDKYLNFVFNQRRVTKKKKNYFMSFIV